MNIKYIFRDQDGDDHWVFADNDKQAWEILSEQNNLNQDEAHEFFDLIDTETNE